MKIDYPAEAQMPQLRALWQEAFADEAPFIDAFFATAFGADRCLCATEGQNVAAALYWLDCRLEGRPLAYLYAIATARQYRRRGFCRGLIDRAKAHLQELGYAGLLLVPGDAGLARMYEDMGFAFCTHVREFTCHRGDPPVTLRALEPAEYARLRRDYLPMAAYPRRATVCAFCLPSAGFMPERIFCLPRMQSCWAIPMPRRVF